MTLSVNTVKTSSYFIDVFTRIQKHGATPWIAPFLYYINIIQAVLHSCMGVGCHYQICASSIWDLQAVCICGCKNIAAFIVFVAVVSLNPNELNFVYTDK